MVASKFGADAEVVPEAEALDGLFIASRREVAATVRFDEQTFDAAIVDVHLPDSPDGEVVDFMVERDVPTIVFTGAFDPALRERILAKNVFDYVLKDTPDAIDAVTRQQLEMQRGAEQQFRAALTVRPSAREAQEGI